MSKTYKTIDLCAGIGGIRRGYELAGGFENVLSAEIDKNACLTYEHLYHENPLNDITTEEFKKKVEDIEYDDSLSAKIDDIIAIDRSEITITRVSLFDLEGVQKDISILYNKNDFKIPNIKGEYLVSIDTISNRGTAWYSFKLKID